MNDVMTSAGPSLSASEEAYFSSGGEAEISDAGSGSAGGEGGVTNNDGGDGSTSLDGNGSGEGGGNQPGSDQGGKSRQHVPLAALQEERSKRQALGETVKTLETQLAEMRGRFAVLDRLAPQTGEQEKPAAPPTPEEDIFGAVKHVGETVAQMQKRLDDEKAAKDKADKDAADHSTFVNNYKSDVAQFKAKTPDFMDAYNFLLKSRADELKAIGYEGIELHNAIVADEQAIVQRAFAAKKSPGEMLYALAKGRGFQSKAAAADADADATALLETIERGQNGNKSLNGTGAPGGEQGMTAERLLAMPMAEYEAWVEKNPAKARAIMGG